MFTNPRISSSCPRTTTTGTRPAWQVKYWPGSATQSVIPAYCHVLAKMRSCSSRKIVGSANQENGSVIPWSSFDPSSVAIAALSIVRLVCPWEGRGHTGAV